jgi:predicted phage terminase large subunit-like protein
LINDKFNEVQKVKEKPDYPLYARLTSVEERIIKKSRKNFADFFFYMTDMSLARHHFLWVISILTHKRTNIIAPRGAAKTTIINVFLAWWIGRFPYLSNIFVCVAEDQAKERLADIKEIIESQKFKNVFPHVFIDTKRPRTVTEFSVWSDRWKDETGEITYEQFRMRIRSDKKLDSKSKTLIAFGTTSSKIPGKRCSGILALDDPHDERNSATEDQRIKVEMLVKKSLMPTMTPEARMVLICTRWAETDLSGRFKNDFRADGTPVWNTIETAAIDENGKSYWEGVWSLERLEEVRDEFGEIVFQLMYMNNPMGLASGEVTMDMLRQNIIDLPEDLEIFISVDVAESLTKRADYTVFAIVARDKPKKTASGERETFNYYVLYIWRDKVKFLNCVKQLEKMYEFAEDHYGPVKKVLFEKSTFQSAWGDLLVSKNPDIKIDTVPLKEGNKEWRFKSFAARAQAGRVYMNMKMKNYHIACSEIIAFPTAAHDDIVDALGMPLIQWGYMKNIKSGRTKVPLTRI